MLRNQKQQLLINCSMCDQPYGQLKSNKQPRVIPCGHTYCQDCVNQYLNSNIQTYQCYNCQAIHSIESIQFAPVNHLYYKIQQQLKSYLRKRQFQGDLKKKSDAQEQQNRQVVDIQFQCLSIFCHNPTFQKDGVRQAFCSINCLKLYQSLLK